MKVLTIINQLLIMATLSGILTVGIKVYTYIQAHGLTGLASFIIKVAQSISVSLF